MAPAPSARPTLDGIHHLKLPVADLNRSLRFYEAVFGAERLPDADYRREGDGTLYGFILRVPGLGALLELRFDPEAATRRRGFDPFTVAVADRAALARWSAHLAAAGVPHSPVITAIQAWLVVLEDPDGHSLRLYTRETYGRDVGPDEDNPWLRSLWPASSCSMPDPKEPAMTDPVLIVGAGPTGLTATFELARMGVAVRLGDKRDAPATTSRAIGVQARTLELQRLQAPTEIGVEPNSVIIMPLPTEVCPSGTAAGVTSALQNLQAPPSGRVGRLELGTKPALRR